MFKQLTSSALACYAAIVAALVSPTTTDALAQGRKALIQARNRMVDTEIVAAGVKNRRVIAAMRKTPRHEFVQFPQRKYAYLDMALPIGHGQTISPPFIVAYMTEQIDPKPTDRILEIGTGSGYQAAVLSGLAGEVYSVEIVEPLGLKAAQTLKRLHCDNVKTKIGDGFEGWPEYAPFDKIIVTCSPERIPRPLVAQLKEGGRMIVPVGERYQQVFYMLTKRDGKLKLEALRPTLFVPMTGQAESYREVMPDPSNPEIRNGNFEEMVSKEKIAAGWHYQRQLEIVEDVESPFGNHYAKFTNSIPGKGCRALQGFPVDGRTVKSLKVKMFVKGKDIRPGYPKNSLPHVMITFYDEKRAMLRTSRIGPWLGTFDWQMEKANIDVPILAREAIIHIGLFGAVGELCFDGIEMTAIRKK